MVKLFKLGHAGYRFGLLAGYENGEHRVDGVGFKSIGIHGAGHGGSVSKDAKVLG